MMGSAGVWDKEDDMQLTEEQVSEWMNSAFPGHTRRDFEVAKAAIAFAAHNAGVQTGSGSLAFDYGNALVDKKLDPSYCEQHCKTICQNSVHEYCRGAPEQPKPMTDAVRHRLQRLIAAWTASANEEQVKRDVDAIGVAAGIRGCVRDVQLLLAEIERLDRAKGE